MKIYVLLMSVFTAALLLTGCGNTMDDNTDTPDNTSTTVASETEMTTPDMTEMLEPETEQSVTGGADAQTMANNSEARTISADEAKNAALAHAGINADDASGLRAERDFDDGRYEYDVEFYANGTEYDYKIDAQTGDIISFDNDRD